MKMCAPRLAKPVPLQTNSGDTSSARKARRTVIKDEHRAKAAQRHEVYQERTNKQNDQLKTIKVMKRRNIYIASTLVLALVLMVGFPTSAKPQVLKGFIKGVVKRLNSPAKTSAIALMGAQKMDAYAKKRIEQQRRRAVRPVVIPPSVQAKLMLEQMKKPQHYGSPPQGEARGSEKTSPAAAENPSSEARQRCKGCTARQGRTGSRPQSCQGEETQKDD